MSHKVENPKNSIFLITLNLTIASLISGLIIASVYFFTAPFAEKQRIKLKNDTMRALVPNATGFKPLENKEGWFSGDLQGQKIAYVFPVEGKGYGGTIRIMMAVDLNEKIMGFTILAHNETPGLGDRASQPKFHDQFIGKGTSNLEVVKTHDGIHIDAMSGATITSRAVTKAIREGMTGLDEWIKIHAGKPESN